MIDKQQQKFMSNNVHFSDDEALLNRLKDILLTEDRNELLEIKKVLNSREHLSHRVSPIIEEHLDLLKANFSTEYEDVINGLIEVKMKDSQDEILDIIYPAMGRMIKKFINLQFQLLKEKIESSAKSAFSFSSAKRKVKSFFTGVNESDIILSETQEVIMEEIFLIEKDSGLLLGSASQKKTMDQDVIAGMLTAIKAFVEDAFKREKQELELIEYGNYKILIQTFHSYYIAAAISGPLSSAEQEKISQRLHDFAADELSSIKIAVDESNKTVSEKLKTQFILKKL